MPYEMSWYKENRVIYIRVFDELTLDELIEISEKSIDYINMGIAPVHSLSDQLAVTRFPNSLTLLRQKLPSADPNLSGWFVSITESRLQRFLAGTLVALTGAKYKSSSTMEEAVALLNRIDPTLDLEVIPMGANDG